MCTNMCYVIDSEIVDGPIMSSGWLGVGMRKPLFKDITVNSLFCQRVKKWEIL